MHEDPTIEADTPIVDEAAQAAEVERVFSLLQSLLGTWHGQGSGNFPTIEHFRYEEELSFHCDGAGPYLHMEQRTWKLDEQGERGAAIHWESGFLRVTDSGGIDFLNAQNSGRVEVMIGTLEIAESGALFIRLESTTYGHDPRMISSTRCFQLAGSRLSYEMRMQTQDHPAGDTHLSAELKRS